MEGHAQAAIVTTPEQLSTGGCFGIVPEQPPPFAGHMAHYSHTHNPYDIEEEETYMHWLDKDGFPAMRELLIGQGWEDVAVLRSVPDREALGVFHAVSTRDGEAQARDGEAFYALNRLGSQGDEAMVEIQFSDGTWMLATPTDLEISGL